MHSIIHFLQSIGLSKEIIVAIISMMPIFELRGGIPLGVFFFKMNILSTAIISITANILVIPPILWLLKPVNKWLESFEQGNNIIEKLRKRAIAKSKIVQKLEFFGLMLFVAMPLPGSGAWTGALIAFFLKMSLKKSLLYIILGVIIAGILVTFLTYLFNIGIIKSTGIFIKKVGV